MNNGLFIDGTCPICRKPCGNNGSGMTLHCSCGWSGGLDPRDAEMIAEIIKRHKERNGNGEGATMNEPKPDRCPFCGNSAIIVEIGGGADYQVKCRNIMECGAMTEKFDTEGEAIAAWNRRAPSPENKPLMFPQCCDCDCFGGDARCMCDTSPFCGRLVENNDFCSYFAPRKRE